MIIYWLLMFAFGVVVGLMNLRFFRRELTRPTSGLPWWAPVLGFCSALLSVSLATWGIMRETRPD